MNYSTTTIENHWRQVESDLHRDYSGWVSIFRNLIPVVGEVLIATEGKRNLFDNCVHLLLSKSVNHSLSTFTLLSRGLLIDASLCARNAVETFLLLEFLATDSSEKHINDWANGKEFRPAEVRKELGESLNVIVRDVIITCDDDYYKSLRIAYSFWSDITHGNLKSAEHSVELRADGSISVPTGGILKGKNALVNCTFTVVCSGLLRTALILSAVLDVGLLQRLGERFGSLQKDINIAIRSDKT